MSFKALELENLWYSCIGDEPLTEENQEIFKKYLQEKNPHLYFFLGGPEIDLVKLLPMIRHRPKVDKMIFRFGY